MKKYFLSEVQYFSPRYVARRKFELEFGRELGVGVGVGVRVGVGLGMGFGLGLGRRRGP